MKQQPAQQLLKVSRISRPCYHVQSHLRLVEVGVASVPPYSANGGSFGSSKSRAPLLGTKLAAAAPDQPLQRHSAQKQPQDDESSESGSPYMLRSALRKLQALSRHALARSNRKPD
eukprot:SAG31_NODE_3269_length_4478_cov_2.680521_6_plen_116_part_00